MKRRLVDGLVDELLSKERWNSCKQLYCKGLRRISRCGFMTGLVDGLVVKRLYEVINSTSTAVSEATQRHGSANAYCWNLLFFM